MQNYGIINEVLLLYIVDISNVYIKSTILY